jgi:hypothetical protein
MSRLRERIRRAQTPGPTRVLRRETDDPLEQIGRFIEQARDLDADERLHAAEPLASLYDLIDEAHALEPAEAPGPSGDDPLDTIRGWIDDEAEAVGPRSEPLAGRLPARAPTRAEDASIKALLGREVLAMVADEPLSSDARLEATRLLAEALQNPDETAIRRVLRVLLRG